MKSHDRKIVERFTERYSRAPSDALDEVERHAVGAAVGANGYTTVDQADALLDALRLSPAHLLLDIGAGRGWPGLYLADKSGCRAVISDVPAPAIESALRRANDLGLAGGCHFALASGGALPFADHAFDAIVHTDTL